MYVSYRDMAILVVVVVKIRFLTTVVTIIYK